VGTNVDYYTNGKIRAERAVCIANGSDSKLTEYTAEEKVVLKNPSAKENHTGHGYFMRLMEKH
jgi:hypothetical protein